MPHLVTRSPSSLPNLPDTRSEYSPGSRATVSTTAARNYYPQVSHNNNNNHHASPHHSYNLNGVSANFVLDNKDDQSLRVVASDGYGYNSATSQQRGSRALKQAKVARRKINFKHTPAMLLPEKENRRPRRGWVEPDTDDGEGSFASFISSLRQASVVPNDPEKLPIIIAPVSQSSNGNHRSSIEDLLLSPRSNSSLSLDSLDGSKVHGTIPSTLNDSMTAENGGEYIDTFSDNNDIARFRWTLLRSKLKSKRLRKQSLADQQQRSVSDEDSMVSGSEMECPICAKAAQNLGGEEALVKWILDKLTPKRNLFPRYNSITRGTIPHFCNFVKKVRLKEKETERPQPDHTHTRHRGDDQEGASSNPVHAGSSDYGSHDSMSGRPSSPASIGDDSTSNHGNTGWPQDPYSESLSQESLDISSLEQVPERSLDESAVNQGLGPSHLEPLIFPAAFEMDLDKLSDDSLGSTKLEQVPEEPLVDSAAIHISVPTDSAPYDPLANEVSSSDQTKLNSLDQNGLDDGGNKDGNGDKNQNGDAEGKDQSNSGDDKDLMQTTTTTNTDPTPPQKVNRTLMQPPPMINRPAEPRNSPFPHQNVPTKKPRAPIVKKEKKPFERQRQEKQEEEVEETKMEETEKEEEVVVEVKSPDLPAKPKLEAVVPDLPSFKDKELKSKRRLGSSRGGKQGIKFLSPYDDPEVDKDTLENMKDQRKSFELTVPETTKEDYSQKPRMQSWLQARLALSQQSSRFELPMDIKTLEKMSGQDYLKKHCVISTRRSALYHKVHTRYKEKGGLINVKDLDRALQDVLVNTITSADTKHICEVVGLEEDGSVDFKLFAGLAAMAERMLYPKFVTDDTSDMKEFKKETIECADFSSLDWKLHGVKVNPQVHTILKCL